jgi:uncharacterized membrane protein YdjX (TVP38/TMEM64 family)
MVGYLAGYSGQIVVANSPHYPKIAGWINKNAALTIFVLSAFPNPLFDLAGITAGIFRVPIWKFFIFCWLGITLKMLFISFLGAYSFDLVSRFF